MPSPPQPIRSLPVRGCLVIRQLFPAAVSLNWVSSDQISDGNLVLVDESQATIWATDLNSTGSGSGAAVQAVLLDDGNFVLRDGPNPSASVLWQSFDHPSHTWLPGVKIRLDKRSRKSQRLTSWKNLEDPSPGLFSLELDPDGSNSYIILWNRSKSFWSSGSWNDQSKIFSGVPEMRLNYIYNFSFESNANESYFTYSLYDASIISRFVMDISGQIKQFTWLNNNKQWNLFWSQPRQQCEVHAYCGSFGICGEKSQPFCQCVHGFRPASQGDWDLKDYSGGCIRNTELQCLNATRNSRKNDFLPLQNMKLAADPEKMATSSLSLCASTCITNCSCKAYAFDHNNCSIWIGDVLNLQQLDEDNSKSQTFYLRLATSDIPVGSSNKSKNDKATIIGAILGSLGITALLSFVLTVVLVRRRRRMEARKATEGTLVAFCYRDLQTATKNFSDKLGGGGFGSVFKGTLPDSSAIAVKKLESISQGEKQFRTEVSTIGTIQHVNLVRLRGFCSEGNTKLLVYDHMLNGSLDFHLFNQMELKTLDWKTRYQIALGTARGLAYLHDECRDCIIHCDIKPENILLDAQFCPKVADFGLAKLVGRDFSRVLTTMRGTRGYLAPEWISGVAITAKADVYSYGMMLFEFVSGRRNTEQSGDGKVNFFPSWAATVLTGGGDVLSLLDPRLDGNADAEELSRICKVACWCIQDDENHRPTMSQVVQIIEGVLDVNPPPFPRSIQVFMENEETVIFFTESSSSQSSQQQSLSSSTNTNNSAAN
ncbi:PREDICTED: G-type lectin S-receptor-like serine/threonine-protein kinase At2g19130 isoform X2 [Tarenaya hassleriana]|uniref:G-type lectin S-receptor-like serine/threonine-protein kinase At2g19130 isoform X2 n=1 Tax=Tarenaya hassleriana TaxID=28532 RepID=UPI00053C518D|nr:PREDICTED: G-type lectin S-receptor-like serine/threonine-protein kinase At2g19130 isoform X2 [Tarenaya hassleriana]